jgi:hypothetical protein
VRRDVAVNALVAALSAVFAASLALGGPPKFLPPWTALFLLSAAMCAKIYAAERRVGRRCLESRPDASLFWLCLTLYLGTFRWHGGDDIPNSLLPYEIWRHGSLAFDDFRSWATTPGMIDLIHDCRGRLLSTYPILPGVLAAPLYLIPALVGAPPTDTLLHNLAKVSGALIVAASAVVFRRAALRRASPKWALQCAFLYAFASYAYSVSSQALYSHGPAALGIAVTLWGLLEEGPGWSALAGFGAAAAWASREDSAVFALAALGYLALHRPRRLAAFLVGAVLPILFNLSYWRYYTGTFQPPYYALQAHLFGRFDVEAALGMLVSPTRGMLFYFPAAGFGIWGAVKAARAKEGLWAPYFLAACFATWGAFAMRTSWTAGNSYGDRYFAVVCMVLALFCAELEDEIRKSPFLSRAWSAAFAFGALIHAVGANFAWPGYNATLEEQARTAWSFAMFPLVRVFADGGPISATPMPWRALYGGFLLAAIGFGAWRVTGRTRA